MKHRCGRCKQYVSARYKKSLEKEIDALRERIKYLEGKQFYDFIRKDAVNKYIEEQRK